MVYSECKKVFYYSEYIFNNIPTNIHNNVNNISQKNNAFIVQLKNIKTGIFIL